MANNSACITSRRTKVQWDPANVTAALSHIPERITRDDYPDAFTIWSGHFAVGSKQESQRNNCIMEVINSLIMSSTEPEKATVCLVSIADNQMVAEHTNDEGETTVVTCSAKGMMKGCVINGGKYCNINTLPDDSADLTPVYACYFGLMYSSDILADQAGEDAPDYFKRAVDTLMSSEDPYNEVKLIYTINEAILTGLDLGLLPAKITVGNISLLEKNSVENAYTTGKLIFGEPKAIRIDNILSDVKGMTAKQAKSVPIFAEYAKSRVWTEEEEKLIPTFPDDYPVPPETVMIARNFVMSRNKKRPMVNFLWRGITAYGKSTGVEMLAYILHTPLLRVTCSSGMEAQSFLAEFVPDSENTDVCQKLPSIDELMYDPESAYKAMTGKQSPGITAQDALMTFGRICAARGKGGNARFKLVESNYVKALRGGYICEVQEMSRIKDAGTMVTLNEYDRPNARIPLVDGTATVRSPSAIVVYTDNVGYTSCHGVDPSVMRRMDCVYDSFTLSDAQVKNRVMYNTGFTDGQKLDRMIEIWKAVADYCRVREIDSGEISVNELERWVDVYMITGEAQYGDACRRCIVAKASPDREVQEEIWNAVILPRIAE